MEDIFNFFISLASSDFIVQRGYLFILLVVFAESGLFFGFFLPGDYLLFLTGVFIASGNLEIGLEVMIVLMIVSASLGNGVGYLFGLRLGLTMYKWKDGFFFKKRYLKKAENFYQTKGTKAIIIGKFLPIVRTFVPIIAGIIKMNKKQFLFLNLIGNILWIASLVSIGYYIGHIFPNIHLYIQYIILGFIIITMIPLLKIFFFKKSKS